MATVGFWPVKGRLKEVLLYAENPDKTTDRKHLNEDLWTALRYAKDDAKTDQTLFVSGINCSKSYAYEEMVAVKQRFGERGKNIAYHGYQSFVAGEVTPAEAHKIGMETARKMWGNRYQVLVTTHLNTNHLHNHFVVNSVSFMDGKKFRNSIGEHMELRKISDAVCLEHGKSVLRESDFTKSQSRGAYRYAKGGGMTHREQLKRDIESILPYSTNYNDFCRRLTQLGYKVKLTRGRENFYYSVFAPGWQRPVRLAKIGYPRNEIESRIRENWERGWESFRGVSQKKVSPPLIDLMKQLESDLNCSKDGVVLLLDSMFLILITLLQAAKELLSPELRREAQNLKQYVQDYHFLQDEGIHTEQELITYLGTVQQQISDLETQRSKADHLRRRAHTPEAVQDAKSKRKSLTEQLRPLREKQKQSKRILEKSPRLYELLQTEQKAERTALGKARARERSR